MGRSFSSAQRTTAPGATAVADWRRPRRVALVFSAGAVGHRARRNPRGNRLARTAGVDADRAGRLGENPAPDRRARRRIGSGRAEGTGQGRRRARPGRCRGPARPPFRAAGVRFRLTSIRSSSRTPADVRVAERRLLRSLVKDTDGFMARHVERPISLQISRRLAATAITPNQMSLISIAVGICGGPFFLSARPLMQTIGALLFLAHSILDGCDGELARLKFQQSRWGGVLDFWGDNVVHTVIFACMGVGWSLSAGSPWPLALGAGAVLGTLGSAGFVYWRLMRGKDGGDTLVHLGVGSARAPADAASRFRLAPRFHLSRDPARAVRPIELVSGHGRDRRADLFSPGAFRRAPARPAGDRLQGRARRKSMSARSVAAAGPIWRAAVATPTPKLHEINVEPRAARRPVQSVRDRAL